MLRNARFMARNAHAPASGPRYRTIADSIGGSNDHLCLSSPRQTRWSPHLAGFEISAFASSLLLGGFSGLGLTVLAGFAASDPVVTSLAGFAGGRRPHPPGGRTAIPAAFRYAPAVSRRTPVACSMRRSVQPSFPSAITCCFFSSFKTLLMRRSVSARIQCPERPLSLAGFQLIIIGRLW